MRFLIDDLIKAAALSTDVANSNYPVESLQHPFLRKRYQADATTATVTATLAAVSTVDCFFYGYHNCTEIVVRLYSSAPALLKTVTVSAPEAGVGSEFFAEVASVATAEIDITAAAEPVYVGGVGLGTYYEAPRPAADFEEGLIDNSVVVSSPAGQTHGLYVEPLQRRRYTISNMTRTVRAEIAALMKAKGIGVPMWIDVFYSDHDYDPPMYGKIITPWSTVKSGRRFDAQTLEIQEAR